MQKVVVISLGGSLINGGTIDTKLIQNLKRTLDKIPAKFILVCGGGKPARDYAKAARALGVRGPALDEIGIRATALNAELIRHAFRAGPVETKPRAKKFAKYLVACGWKTGGSSDHDTVLWARVFRTKTILNLTNVSYVYTKDPRLPGAKPLPELTWAQYRRIIGNRWESGVHAPFDPVASKAAEQFNLSVIITNGKDTPNLKKLLTGKNFQGTVIQ